jgi:hypothetical protein
MSDQLKKLQLVVGLGTIVIYQLSQADADAITLRRSQRGSGCHGTQGNYACEGTKCAALVVADFGGDGKELNLKVELDGEDCFWATSRQLGEGPGQWQPTWKPGITDVDASGDVIDNTPSAVEGIADATDNYESRAAVPRRGRRRD